jgi:eukaryotic-like serine/threonine-protein kinase
VADLCEQLQSGLVDRYRLDRELGRGGMATVFLAQDLRHDRPVALKVLHPELAATLGPERFLREIKLVARLQHPHILTVHDSGETAGQLWFTMPFVEGESLRDRLRRDKQLPIEDALRIATDAARALDYAHHHGVVHRDIKPENLLLTTDGSTLVADFGIARALSGGEEHLTQTGMSVGTPTYMSPEQAAGERTLDARTDIYSLACVLYEMLAAEPPFTGPTAQAVIAKRLSGEVPRVRQVRPSVPESVDQAVTKALAPVPADRFSTAAEFARALATAAANAPTHASAGCAATSATATPPRLRRRQRMPVGVATLVLGFLVGLGVLFAWRRAHRADEVGGAGPKRLAVLPFDNVGDSADVYFADGVTDAVRGKLANVADLQVIASASADEYKHTQKPLQQVARELGVNYLLVGKIRWQKGEGASRVEVSPELIDLTNPGTPTTRWQKPFGAALTDVFQVQADIAGQVAQALGVALGTGEREQLAERPTKNLAAYDAYLKGEEISGGSGDVPSLRRAAAAYEQAVALDSSFAVAWAQLSRTHSWLYGSAQLTPAEAEQARTAAERALALAPDRFEGHLALGDYYSTVRVDYARALDQYSLARRTAPKNAEVLAAAAVTQESLGRWDAAIAQLRQALALDPRSGGTARRLARALLWLRRYPEAIEANDRALALSATNIDAIENKAMIYLAQGDLAGARAVLRAAPHEVDPTILVANVSQFWDLYWVLDEEQQQLLMRLTPVPFGDDRGGWGLTLASVHGLRGNQLKARAYADSARSALQQAIEANPHDAQLHVILGTALAYLGQRDEAVREGIRAVAMLPVAKDGFAGPYLQHQLARIYLLVGNPEKALDQLEPLLKIPYYLSPDWLKIDPNFASLRGNPRFERLVNGT